MTCGLAVKLGASMVSTAFVHEGTIEDAGEGFIRVRVWISCGLSALLCVSVDAGMSTFLVRVEMRI